MCALGFGFVGFESEDVVDRVCQVHYHQINGKTVCTCHFVACLLSGGAYLSGGGTGSSLFNSSALYVLYLLQVEAKKAEPRYSQTQARFGGGMNAASGYGGQQYPGRLRQWGRGSVGLRRVIAGLFFPPSLQCQSKPTSLAWCLHCEDLDQLCASR